MTVEMASQTASAERATEHRSSSLARVPAAFRLHLVNRQLIWIPLIVFGGAWALSLGIGLWAAQLEPAGSGPDDPVYTGSGQAALWCLAFMAAYSGSHTFPFALALSFSRRVYLLGTLLVFLMIAVCYGLLFGAAAALEEATDGLGMHTYSHALPFLVADGLWVAGLTAAAVALMLMLIGFGATMLYRRFGVVGFWAVLLTLTVLTVVAVLLTVQAVGWDGFWGWFGRQTPLSAAGWSGLVAVVMAGVDYGLIRRATP
ncbi:hypothetical protein GCM10027060_12580 [Nesterenkonia halophila]|uniref:hypothetical protein n=1 Tax=Nesterenkonia halophila TaxID=302044 RepID=UPI0012929767|nr:hypothetical protein [Nesterenkonia halophila]